MSAHSPYFSPSALGDAPADSSAFAIAFRFAGKHWLTVSGISILILAPCFWHREIVASDLGSHLYNAWLVQLIHRGQSPGLWIAPQHTNILFDIMLSNLGSILGLRAAEKLVVSLAVLNFFWGTFTFVSAAVKRAPWFLLPCIALVTTVGHSISAFSTITCRSACRFLVLRCGGEGKAGRGSACS